MMKNNKAYGWWIGRIVASLLIPFVSMFLMSIGLSSNQSYFLWFFFPIIFGIPAFFLSLFLLYLLGWGLRNLWNGMIEMKLFGFSLIVSATLAPFCWANWANLWQVQPQPIAWWLIPLTASVMLLLYSALEFALGKVAEYKAKKPKAKKDS